MRRLTADRNGDGKIDLWGSIAPDIAWDRLQIVNGWGGHFVDPEDRLAASWLGRKRWRRWGGCARIWDDHMPDGEQARRADLETRHAFIKQSLAMVEDGSWALRDILERLAPFRIGVAPFPAGPQRRVTLATTDGFAVYSGTKHPEAAWELMKFFVSPEYGRAMAEAQLLQPARASLVNEWVEIVRTIPGAIAGDRHRRPSPRSHPGLLGDGGDLRQHGGGATFGVGCLGGDLYARPGAR